MSDIALLLDEEVRTLLAEVRGGPQCIRQNGKAKAIEEGRQLTQLKGEKNAH